MTRLRIDSPWDLSLAVSAVVFAVALGFAVVPPAKAIDPAEGLRKGVRTAQDASLKARVVAGQEGRRVADRTWSLQPEALGVQVRDAVDRAAETWRLEFSNFTVGRPVESAGLRQVPFVVTLNGAFPDVVAAMRDLEKPDRKLAVAGVKIVPGPAAAAPPPGTLPGLDDAPPPELGRVTATVAITAFLRPEGV